jgi:hypothetical protein
MKHFTHSPVVVVGERWRPRTAGDSWGGNFPGSNVCSESVMTCGRRDGNCITVGVGRFAAILLLSTLEVLRVVIKKSGRVLIIVTSGIFSAARLSPEISLGISEYRIIFMSWPS